MSGLNMEHGNYGMMYEEEYNKAMEWERIKDDADYVAWKVGAWREHDILMHPHHHEKSETWNDEHKVVHIIADRECIDGHHDSVSVDIVTERICG